MTVLRRVKIFQQTIHSKYLDYKYYFVILRVAYRCIRVFENIMKQDSFSPALAQCLASVAPKLEAQHSSNSSL